jgi:hypothetical protein
LNRDITIQLEHCISGGLLRRAQGAFQVETNEYTNNVDPIDFSMTTNVYKNRLVAFIQAEP